MMILLQKHRQETDLFIQGKDHEQLFQHLKFA
jgi:hypothetical protein